MWGLWYKNILNWEFAATRFVVTFGENNLGNLHILCSISSHRLIDSQNHVSIETIFDCFMAFHWKHLNVFNQDCAKYFYLNRVLIDRVEVLKTWMKENEGEEWMSVACVFCLLSIEFKFQASLDFVATHFKSEISLWCNWYTFVFFMKSLR